MNSEPTSKPTLDSLFDTHVVRQQVTNALQNKSFDCSLLQSTLNAEMCSGIHDNPNSISAIISKLKIKPNAEDNDAMEVDVSLATSNTNSDATSAPSCAPSANNTTNTPTLATAKPAVVSTSPTTNNDTTNAGGMNNPSTENISKILYKEGAPSHDANDATTGTIPVNNDGNNADLGDNTVNAGNIGGNNGDLGDIIDNVGSNNDNIGNVGNTGGNTNGIVAAAAAAAAGGGSSKVVCVALYGSTTVTLPAAVELLSGVTCGCKNDKCRYKKLDKDGNVSKLKRLKDPLACTCMVDEIMRLIEMNNIDITQTDTIFTALKVSLQVKNMFNRVTKDGKKALMKRQNKQVTLAKREAAAAKKKATKGGKGKKKGGKDNSKKRELEPVAEHFAAKKSRNA